MIKIVKHSGIYTLVIKQVLSTDLKTAWAFFSNPENLAQITPPEMGFIQTSDKAQKMYPGQIITYKIGIPGFLKTNWVTEITQVKENSFFIDEQRYGPFSMWHHEHFFIVKGNEIEITDKVSYKIPFGFLGYLAHSIFVKKQLQKIFKFRYEKLSVLFGNDLQ